MSQFSDLAQQHIEIAKQTFGVDLAFDEASIFKLDEIITQGWDGKVPENLETTVTLFGSYLGEAIVQNLSGKWIEQDGRWYVALKGKNGDVLKANVFSKVEKRFKNGEKDSLSYFYQMLKKTLHGEVEFT